MQIGKIVILISAAVAVQFRICAAEISAAEHGYLRAGDIWMLIGASETGIDQYRQLVQAAVDHFHPGSGIRLVNRGVWGRMTEEARNAGRDLKPTVVSILLGGNDILHADRPPVYDFSARTKRYGAEIRRHLKTYRDQGADVFLIKPVLLHETEQGLFFAPHNMRPGYDAYRAELERIAAEENCPLVDFSEEYDGVFEPAVGATEVMMPDGIHAYGRGQYCYARTLIHHLGVARRLARADEPRRIDPTPITAVSDVQVTRVSPFLSAAGVRWRFPSTVRSRARPRWSGPSRVRRLEVSSNSSSAVAPETSGCPCRRRNCRGSSDGLAGLFFRCHRRMVSRVLR